MKTINRTVLLVLPKQPFVDWANSIDDGPKSSLSQMREEGTAFLVSENHETLDAILAQYWKRIFEQQLSSWMTDESTWPAGGTFNMFRRWVDVEWSTVVVDLADEPLTLD